MVLGTPNREGSPGTVWYLGFMCECTDNSRVDGERDREQSTAKTMKERQHEEKAGCF